MSPAGGVGAVRLLSWMVMVPALICVVAFAVANRADVTVGLWPFFEARQVPLYAIVLAGVGLGFVVGAAVVWIGAAGGRRRSRLAARRAETAGRGAGRPSRAAPGREVVPTDAA